MMNRTLKHECPRHVLKDFVNQLHDKFKSEYHALYGDVAELWYNMNRFQMIQRLIHEQGPVNHPLIDKFLLHQIQYKSKTNPEIAKLYFNTIESITRYEFFEWFYLSANFYFDFKEFDCKPCEGYTLCTKYIEGQMLSVVLNETKEIVFITDKAILHTWYYPYKIFVEEIALCSVYNGDDSYIYALIDLENEFLKLPEYSELGKQLIKNNLLKFCQAGKYGYLNLKGEIIVPPQYDYVYGDDYTDTSDLFGYLMIENNGKRGLIDQEFHKLLPCKYKTIYIFDQQYNGQIEDFLIAAHTFDGNIENYRFSNGSLIAISV